jgi:hypothetical protein
MEAYAAQRGLVFEEAGLLPAATQVLSEGAGTGSRLAGIVRDESEHSTFTVGGLTVRPERYTANICRGRLPGGVDGLVAHHVHLEWNPRAGGDHGGWNAGVDTVAFARLPGATRVVRNLQAHPLAARSSAEAQFDLTMDALGATGPQPISTEQHGGYSWVASPGEDQRLLQAIVEPVAAGPLFAVPPGTRIELQDGTLCVSVRGTLEDPAQLDALCHLASAIATGVESAVALLPALDPAAPIGPAPDTAHSLWVDQGLRSVQWPEPPASVPAAQAAYGQLALNESRGKGEARSMRSLIAVVGLVAMAVLVGFDLLLLVGFDQTPTELVLGVSSTILVVGWGIVRAIWQTGKDEETEVDSHAAPLGIEAFAREYARSRGMGLEDPDEFRRRFASPFPGWPLTVFFGELADGPTGRLVLWVDGSDPAATRYVNMAVVPAPARPVNGQVDGYYAATHAGALVLAEEVPDEGRSLDRLDALAVAAARLAGRHPRAPRPPSRAPDPLQIRPHRAYRRSS